MYRSRSLDDVVGQKHIVSTLKRALKESRLSHAYLFTGPRGVGKTSIARILAHEANGLPYRDESLQLDVIEIDAASNRGIDEIRDLREKAHIAPSASKYKVYIIDEVHMLTSPAFNALLKTLEEPPAHAIFILATTEPHKVPDTITSRTQRFSFQPISEADIASHLEHIADQEQIKISSEAALLMAKHARGGLRDAIGFLDQLSSTAERITPAEVQGLLGLAPTDAIAKIIDQTVKAADAKFVLNALNDLYQQGALPAQIAAQMIDYLRDNYFDRASGIELAEKLLEVSSSREPQLKLEVILVGACLNQTAEAAPAPAPEPAKSASKKSSSAKAASKPAADAAKSVVEPASQTSQERDLVAQDEWGEIINYVKTKNNSLYAVLRLARAEISQDNLVLSFAFQFHKARLEEERNKRLLVEAAKSVFDRELSIQSVVDSSLQNQHKKPDPLASVIGVMGGGAVVEYDNG